MRNIEEKVELNCPNCGHDLVDDEYLKEMYLNDFNKYQEVSNLVRLCNRYLYLVEELRRMDNKITENVKRVKGEKHGKLRRKRLLRRSHP